MTAEPGLLYTSKGEIVRDEQGRPVRRSDIRPGHPLHDPRREIPPMPKTKSTDVPREAIEATEATPGTDPDAPLVGRPTRDALNANDYDPDVDYVPGIDEKGYHTGQVRQPAEPIGEEGNLRGFRSTGVAGDSKFAYGSLAHLKAAHNAAEADDPSYRGVETSKEDAFDPAKLRAAEVEAARRGPARETEPPRNRAKVTTED